ncbi:MAG TPA: peptide-methionine (S)-S-oxide reductase MsrA [Rubricoccaceae bacterium]|jgi:peptide-methionine (S)-S-oxide reductase
MPLRPLATAAALSLLVAFGCAQGDASAAPATPASPLADTAPVPPRMETAVFAGGCFWSMERVFDGVRGVQRAVSGFSGGTTVNPSYESTFSNPAGHIEAVQVVFDPAVISYETLVRLFWHNVDPTATDRQFCDQGPTYRAAIFAQTPAQTRVAQASLRQVEARMARQIVARVRASAPFYAAEAYHQDFARLNPARYEQYRRGCRRDVRLRELWGDAAGTAGSRI